jgi:hypothetical protein
MERPTTSVTRWITRIAGSRRICEVLCRASTGAESIIHEISRCTLDAVCNTSYAKYTTRIARVTDISHRVLKVAHDRTLSQAVATVQVEPCVASGASVVIIYTCRASFLAHHAGPGVLISIVANRCCAVCCTCPCSCIQKLGGQAFLAD